MFNISQSLGKYCQKTLAGSNFLSYTVHSASALSLRTPNALDALTSREQVHFEYTSETVTLCCSRRSFSDKKSGREFQTIGPETEKARQP